MSAAQLPATWFSRLLASVIDLILLAIAGTVTVLVTRIYAEPDAYASVAEFYSRFAVVVSLTYLLLNGYLLALRGQTIGKYLLRIQLISNKSKLPLTLWRSMIRAVALLLVLKIPYGFILVLIDPLLIFGSSRRCLRDYLVNCAVVKVPHE